MTSIQEIARQAALKAREVGPMLILNDIADAVAVEVLREVKNLLQAGSYVRYSTPEAVIDEALAAFAPAPVAPPAQPECGFRWDVGLDKRVMLTCGRPKGHEGEHHPCPTPPAQEPSSPPCMYRGCEVPSEPGKKFCAFHPFVLDSRRDGRQL